MLFRSITIHSFDGTDGSAPAGSLIEALTPPVVHAGIGSLPTAINTINIYPNPTSSSITITLPFSITSKNSIINFYDILGEKVLPSYSTQSLQTTIDLSSLSQGIYFLEVITDVEWTVRKVVKIN